MLRLGAVPYINALPLLAGLEARGDVRISTSRPSALPDQVVNGVVDVALVPVAALLSHEVLEPISDACIGAGGRVDSVLLLLRRSPGRIRRLVLDPASRSSQLLARIWLAERHGVRPETVLEGDPRSAWEEGAGDAVLVIGDEALRMRAEGLPHVDLAREWRELTGLPFVFAVWARHRGRDHSLGWTEVARILEGAREEGLGRLAELARTAAAQHDFPEDTLRIYLERRLRYRLGPAEERGLAAFLDRSRRLQPHHSPS